MAVKTSTPKTSAPKTTTTTKTTSSPKIDTSKLSGYAKTYAEALNKGATASQAAAAAAAKNGLGVDGKGGIGAPAKVTISSGSSKTSSSPVSSAPKMSVGSTTRLGSGGGSGIGGGGSIGGSVGTKAPVYNPPVAPASSSRSSASAIEDALNEIGRAQVAYQQYSNANRQDLAREAAAYANSQRDRLKKLNADPALYAPGVNLSSRFTGKVAGSYNPLVSGRTQWTPQEKSAYDFTPQVVDYTRKEDIVAGLGEDIDPRTSLDFNKILDLNRQIFTAKQNYLNDPKTATAQSMAARRQLEQLGYGDYVLQNGGSIADAQQQLEALNALAAQMQKAPNVSFSDAAIQQYQKMLEEMQLKQAEEYQKMLQAAAAQAQAEYEAYVQQIEAAIRGVQGNLDASMQQLSADEEQKRKAIQDQLFYQWLQARQNLADRGLAGSGLESDANVRLGMNHSNLIAQLAQQYAAKRAALQAEAQSKIGEIESKRAAFDRDKIMDRYKSEAEAAYQKEASNKLKSAQDFLEAILPYDKAKKADVLKNTIAQNRLGLDVNKFEEAVRHNKASEYLKALGYQNAMDIAKLRDATTRELGLGRIDATLRGQDLNYALGLQRDATTRRGQDLNYDLGMGRLDLGYDQLDALNDYRGATLDQNQSKMDTGTLLDIYKSLQSSLNTALKANDTTTAGAIQSQMDNIRNIILGAMNDSGK
jgi:hypothetical protein